MPSTDAPRKNSAQANHATHSPHTLAVRCALQLRALRHLPANLPSHGDGGVLHYYCLFLFLRSPLNPRSAAFGRLQSPPARHQRDNRKACSSVQLPCPRPHSALQCKGMFTSGQKCLGGPRVSSAWRYPLNHLSRHHSALRRVLRAFSRPSRYKPPIAICLRESLRKRLRSRTFARMRSPLGPTFFGLAAGTINYFA